MNTNTTLVGIVLAVLLLIGGFFWYTQYNPSSSPTASSTPTGGTATIQPGAPTVVTATDTGVSATTAIFTGSVTPNGSFASYWYEYGTSNALGSKSSSQTVGSGYSVIEAPDYVTGLTRDTTYYYRLVASNSYGTVEGVTYSVTTAHDTPPPVGGTPSAQTSAASGIERTAANLNGQVSPNKASTRYWFEYGTTANLGAITSFQSVGSGSNTTAAASSLTSLQPATTYYFRLDAQNKFGTVIGAIMNFETSGPAATVSPVVTTQVPNSVATTTAILRGTVNPTDLETTYWFEYGTDANFGSGTKTTPQKSLAAAAVTLTAGDTVTGLQSNTTYYYRTVAQNSAGTSRGDSQSFKTK